MKVSLFNDAQMRRDFPNSMVWGDQLPAHLRKADEDMALAFRWIQQHMEKQSEEILEALLEQTFDEDLVWTSAEIAYRISPALLDRLGRRARTGINAEILRLVPERFIAGNGKIGDW